MKLPVVNFRVKINEQSFRKLFDNKPVPDNLEVGDVVWEINEALSSVDTIIIDAIALKNGASS